MAHPAPLAALAAGLALTAPLAPGAQARSSDLEQNQDRLQPRTSVNVQFNGGGNTPSLFLTPLGSLGPSAFSSPLGQPSHLRIGGPSAPSTLEDLAAPWLDLDAAPQANRSELSFVQRGESQTFAFEDATGGASVSARGSASGGLSTVAVHFSNESGLGFSRASASAVVRSDSGPQPQLQPPQSVNVVPTPTAAAAGIALLAGGIMRRRTRPV